MNLGTVSKSQCLGGIFDISQGTNIGSDSSVPSWIVGDTFLVRVSHFPKLVNTALALEALTDMIALILALDEQKNVYAVFRQNPPAVGFAQLSSAAGGSDVSG